MPVEDVHLHRLHTIEVLPDDIERHEVAASIDHQPSPGEAGLVIDGYCCDRVALWGDVDQLKEGLQTVQHAERIGCGEERAGGRDLKVV